MSDCSMYRRQNMGDYVFSKLGGNIFKCFSASGN